MTETVDSDNKDRNEAKTPKKTLLESIYKIRAKVISKFNSPSTSNWMAFSALIISMVTLLKDCQQDSRIQKSQEYQAQLQYRPKIKIAKIEITQIKLGFNQMKDEELVRELSFTDTNTVNDIYANLEMSMKIYLTNPSEAVAKMTAEFYTDTTTGIPFIKAKLPKLVKQFKKGDFINDYYSNLEFSGDDTVILERKMKIQSIKDHTFTLHFLLLYENELGQLFDTYHWERYKCNELIFRYRTIPKSKIIVREINSLSLKNMLSLQDSHSSYSIYTKKEQKNIQKTLNQMPSTQK